MIDLELFVFIEGGFVAICTLCALLMSVEVFMEEEGLNDSYFVNWDNFAIFFLIFFFVEQVFLVIIVWSY